MDDAIGCFSLIVAVIFAAWVFDLNYFSDEVTQYSLKCSVPFNNEGECDGDLKTFHKFNFRILDERQEVIWWNPEKVEESGIGKNKDCRIIDRKNWQCEGIQIVDGIFPPPPINLKVKYVSKFAWWKQKIKQWLAGEGNSK